MCIIRSIEGKNVKGRKQNKKKIDDQKHVENIKAATYIYETQSKQNGNSNKIRNKEFEILILYSWTQEREKITKYETKHTIHMKKKKRKLLKTFWSPYTQMDFIVNTMQHRIHSFASFIDVSCFYSIFIFYSKWSKEHLTHTNE